MALTSTFNGKVLELVHDAATAWTWQDATHGWGAGHPSLSLHSILWIPNAANDVIEILDGSGGPVIFYAKAVDAYDQRNKDFHGLSMSPVIDEAVTTGASQRVIFITC